MTDAGLCGAITTATKMVHKKNKKERKKLYMFEEYCLIDTFQTAFCSSGVAQRFNHFATFNLSRAMGDINTQNGGKIHKGRIQILFKLILLAVISRGHCELLGQFTPPQHPHTYTSVLQVDQPASWPAVCWCRRFKQRGLISISVCVNTLITHLSNEAAVSQPFSCTGIMVCVFVCVWRGRNVRDEGSLR